MILVDRQRGEMGRIGHSLRKRVDNVGRRGTPVAQPAQFGFGIAVGPVASRGSRQDRLPLGQDLILIADVGPDERRLPLEPSDESGRRARTDRDADRDATP